MTAVPALLDESLVGGLGKIAPDGEEDTLSVLARVVAIELNVREGIDVGNISVWVVPKISRNLLIKLSSFGLKYNPFIVSIFMEVKIC